MKLSTAIRRAPKIVHNAVRDLRYGGLLGGTISSRYAHLGAREVGNSDYDDLAILFAEIDVAPDDVIVDVGCGKGRSINFFLSHYPGRRIVGLELDPEVCAATAKRLRRRKNVMILCGDAMEQLPEDGTVFYLFNPFDDTVMRRYADAMLDRPAAATIVYCNAKGLDAFQDDPRFTITEVAQPELSFRSAIISVDRSPHAAATPRSRPT